MKHIFIATIFTLFYWQAKAQDGISYSEDKVIRDGFHISPIMPTTKGFSFGIGYSRPVRSKLLFHGTIAYIPQSQLDGESINATGFSINPSLLYFPDRVDNYKGIVFGIEMPILYYKMQRHDWNWRTSTGDEETFVYQEYQYTKAHALQAGLGAKVGFRTHKRNYRLFWQPTITFGALYQKLYGYTEVAQDQFNDFIAVDAPYAGQNTGITGYLKLELSFGLYRYKKETIKVLQL
jgi:hypothetical protein